MFEFIILVIIAIIINEIRAAGAERREIKRIAREITKQGRLGRHW
jgi:hypothetical protein